MKKVLSLQRMPFYVTPSRSPNNPPPFPNYLPFELCIDDQRDCLVQIGSPKLSYLLTKGYEKGSLVGNALDDSTLGKKYCDDFLDFVSASISPATDLLEIGAGRGYLTRRLIDKNYKVTAIEPGIANEPYWQRYSVPIVRELFPTPAAPGPYGAIVAYGVLEHIKEILAFLKIIRRHLISQGVVVFAVPNCGRDIVAGDPGMLLHEHYQYFTEHSLRRTLEMADFQVVSVRPATYGGALYVRAHPANGVSTSPAAAFPEYYSYGLKVERFRRQIEIRVSNLAGEGKSLGIYCPGRCLPVLPVDASVRFFDDAEELRGLYFPPFGSVVENRSDFLAAPTDELWIMSRTFGQQLADALRPLMLKTTVLTSVDLLSG